jgi:hypothetical protein
MTRNTFVARASLGFALCLMSRPALATSTGDWSQDDIAAGQIRELQTKLMVATLRCRAAGVDIVPSYNQFVAVNRDELRAANYRLKVHFLAAGPAGGQRDYDRYTTALANIYGAAPWDPDNCAQAARLANDAIAVKGNLIAVAQGDRAISTDSPVQLASSLADDGPSPQLYTDRGRPAGYLSEDVPRSYGDDRSSLQAHDGPPPAQSDRDGPARYEDDRGPPSDFRDDSSYQRAYSDQGSPAADYDDDPAPGYREERSFRQANDDHSSPWGYDDGRASPMGYGDRGPSPEYVGRPRRYDDQGPAPGSYDRVASQGYDGDW